MYLKLLEITGFKSFAKKTILDFSRPITAVVGPNGSGKSNVAEAFRFVLGEQSIKSMRGKRSEDLIWNGGGGQIGRSNRASVKVTFDNIRRLLNLDFDEVSLERVVYRDAVSEYLINGSPVRLKDIIELLAGGHIGASGHHIISQGEADHILAANPRERKEMIEDALGLKIFQYKKRESERKLEKTVENIAQVESLRKEIVPHLKFLKKQVERIEKTLELKGELRTLYREYIKRERYYLDAKADEIVIERKGPEEKLRRIESELALAKKVLTESPGLDSKRKELLEIESNLNDVRRRREEHGRAVGRLEGELASLERLAEKARKDALAINSAPVPLSRVQELKVRIEAELDSGENISDISAAKSVFSSIRMIITEFIETYRSTTDASINAYETEIAALLERKKLLEHEITGIRHEEEQNYKKYNAMKELIESEKDKSRDAEKHMFQLMAEQKDAYAALSITKDNETKIVLLRDELEREIREGAMLIGREILDYGAQELVLPDGSFVTREMSLTEERKTQDERLRAIQKIKVRVEDAGAGGGDDVMKEYKEVSEREAFLATELADLEKSSASLVTLIKDLDGKLEALFREGVQKINSQFESFFTLMFGGGKASIKVVTEDPLIQEEDSGEGVSMASSALQAEDDSKPRSGIEIDVKLPRKNIKGLEMLSGGERALTSIALLFAISQVNPPPFIILDETDAALDEANSRKYGEMIENLSKLSQLILITHNRETMSRAGALYGVTMGNDGVSKLLSVAFDEAVAVAK
ncbi:MAG: chromosome segregation protein SMC [Candidatus Taylorbacteria bacterium]|nr:chromosome segregation protein SMC [Candidatus Taylorbacteria bacterium]